MIRGLEPAEQLQVLSNLFNEAETFNEGFRQRGILAVNFYDGNQWTQDELKILKERNQPALVFNRIKPTINTITALQKGNRSDISYKPQDQSEWDYLAARTFTAIAKQDMHKANYHAIESKAFFDYVVTGRGSLQVYYDGEADRLGVEYVDFRNFYPDPSSRYDDLRDANYVHIAQYLSKEEAERLYGEDTDGIVPSESEEYLIGVAERVRVVQTWVKIPIRDKRTGLYYNEYDCVIWSGNKILAYYENPYPSMKRFPVIQMTLYRDLDNVPYGVVNDLVDLQRTINYTRSKATHILNTAKYVYRKGSFEGDEQELANIIAKPNSLIPLEMGKEDIADISPKSDLAALWNIMQEAKSEIPEIAGLGEEIQATSDKVMSGRAIALRQQSGLAKLTEIFDGLKRFKIEVGRAVLGVIRDYYDINRVARIVIAGGEIPPEQIDQVRAMWQRINSDDTVEFDVVHATDPITISQQEEAYNNLLQIFSINPQAVPIEALIQASNWSNKDQVLEILQQTNQKNQLIAQQQQQLEQLNQAIQQLQKNAEAQLKALQDELKKKDETILKLMEKIGVSRLLENENKV